jgi:hypothetical protein
MVMASYGIRNIAKAGRVILLLEDEVEEAVGEAVSVVAEAVLVVEAVVQALEEREVGDQDRFTPNMLLIST